MPRREDATVSDRCSPKDRREAEGFALRRKGDPMTEINAKGLSRRAFFGLGATAAAGAAVAGLAGCSPAPQSDAAAPATTGDTTMPATGTATYEWEIAPEPITDIASTVDTDILVIGAGLSGCACAAAAAEKGGKVTVVEKTGSFNGRGGGFGAINSRYMEAQNIVVDKVNAKQHWIAQCASRTNEDLIVKFFNNSEEASNWLIDKCEALGGSAMGARSTATTTSTPSSRDTICS